MFLMTDQMESDSGKLCIATGTPLHMVKYDPGFVPCLRCVQSGQMAFNTHF